MYHLGWSDPVDHGKQTVMENLKEVPEKPRRLNYSAFSKDDEDAEPLNLQTPMLSPPEPSSVAMAMSGAVSGIKRSCVMSFAVRGRNKDRDVPPVSPRNSRRGHGHRAHAHGRGDRDRSPSFDSSRGRGREENPCRGVGRAQFFSGSHLRHKSSEDITSGE